MNCKPCLEHPGFHSFEFMKEANKVHFYYCFLAHNRQAVRTIEDVHNFVSHFPTDRPWSLIFHANGYGMNHLMPLNVAIEMGKLIQENKYLKNIFIVEGSWFMNFLHHCIFPFLRKEMRQKIILIEGSILEVMARLGKEGLTLQDVDCLRHRFGKKIEV